MLDKQGFSCGEGRIRTSEDIQSTDLQSVAFGRSATSPKNIDLIIKLFSRKLNLSKEIKCINTAFLHFYDFM